MADDHAVTKTRLSSSGSPTDMGSTSRAVNASSPCDSDVLSPSRTGFAKKELIMTPPEEKLKHFESRAQAHGDSQEFDACIQDLVRCVALARLVYGDGHLKLAQAHGRLAKAYFQFKGWGQQAQEHCILARELLPFCSTISSCREEKLEILTCLLSVHLTQGGASLLTASLEEAESSFLEAEQVAEELQQRGGINQTEKIKTELEISAGLSSEENNIFQILSDYVSKDSSRVGTQSYRVYKRQNKLEEALNQCEKSLQLLTVCGQPEKTCSVYRDMAAIEQDRGHLDRAIEHLSKAHAIAVSHSPEELEGAQISHSLALILSAAAEPHHNDSAGHYFEQSLSAYKNSAGPQDPAFLAAQDDFCRFLLFSGQQEIFCSESSTMETPSERCVEIQRASLTTKRSTFGDLSVEVADTLQLIGSVEMTEGRMKQAHRTMTKCLEIQSLLYGPQHRKTKATQKAVDMLARAPEVAERQQRQGRRKTEPHTFSIVPSSGNDGNSMPDS